MSEGSSKGNGADVGAILQAVLALGTELRAQGRRMDRGFAELRAELAGKADRTDVAALREEVASYHASVVGHGVLISELDDRLGQLERGDPPPKAA